MEIGKQVILSYRKIRNQIQYTKQLKFKMANQTHCATATQRQRRRRRPDCASYKTNWAYLLEFIKRLTAQADVQQRPESSA